MSFQQFAVTCVTCGSRLRVSRPDLVGTIVNCPKCHSMVELTPPSGDNAEPGPVAIGGAPVDSGAVTEDSISNTGPSLPSKDSSSHVHGTAAPPPVFGSTAPAAAEGEDSASGDGPESPASIPLEWHSENTAKKRRLAMTVLIALAGVMVVGIFVAVLLRRPPQPNTAATQPPAGPGAPASESESERENSTAEVRPSVAVDSGSDEAPDEPHDDSSGRDPENGESEDTAQSDGDVSADKSPENASDPEPVINGTPKSVEPTDPDSSESPGNPSNSSNPLIPTSPLLPPNPLQGMTDSGPVPGTPQADAADDTASLLELPDELKSIFGALEDSKPQFETTQPAPKGIDEIELDRAAEFEANLEVMMEEPDAVNWRQALSLTIAMQSSDPDGYPFNDLMSVLSQLAGAPIEVEWISFDLVGDSINRRVQLPRKWMPIESILDTVCDETGARYEVGERSITIKPDEERFAGAVADLLDLGDLGDGAESAAATVRELLGQPAGDPTRIEIPEDAGKMQLAGLVCETLRRVRSAEGKMPDAALARWAGPFKAQLAGWPRIEGGVSGAPRLQPASFSSILRGIAKQNGATCFVNWQDAALRQVRPNDEIMPLTGEGITAAQVLDGVLSPVGLHARAVDTNHWWVGADATFDRFPVVVWFDENRDAQRTRELVASVLESASSEQAVLGGVVVDPKSDRCLAVLPRYLLRQLPRLLENQ